MRKKTKDMKLEIKSRFVKWCNASKRNRRFSTLNVCITKLIKSIKNEQAKKETIPKREHRHKDQTWVKL